MKKSILIAALAVTALTGTALAQTTSTPSATMPPSPTSPSTPPSVMPPSAMPSTTGGTPAAASTTPGANMPATVLLGRQKTDEALSSELIGAAVYAVDGERVGDVDDLVIDTTGRVSGVVIGVGGLLGVGEKNVAVDYTTVTKSKESNGRLRLTVRLTKGALEAAAPYVTAEKS